MWLLWSRSQCSNYHGDDFVLLWFTSPTSDVHVCTYYIVRAGKLLWWFTFWVCLPPLTSIPQVDAMILQVATAGWQEPTARSELGFENRGFCAAFRDFHVAFPVLPADGRDWPHTGTAPAHQVFSVGCLGDRSLKQADQNSHLLHWVSWTARCVGSTLHLGTQGWLAFQILVWISSLRLPSLNTFESLEITHCLQLCSLNWDWMSKSSRTRSRLKQDSIQSCLGQATGMNLMVNWCLGS